jgi:hypothetical protein
MKISDFECMQNVKKSMSLTRISHCRYHDSEVAQLSAARAMRFWSRGQSSGRAEISAAQQRFDATRATAEAVGSL